MFTQGIVIHETYRSENGDWLMPAEVRIEGEGAARKAVSIATGRPVEIGPFEKMSKSRKNVVDPDDFISHYGADTARLFIVSDSPPDRDIIWTEAGVAGRGPPDPAHLAADRPGARSASPEQRQGPPAFGAEALALRRAAHKTLNSVSQNIEGLRYNVAVAQIYELTHALSAALEQVGRRPGLGRPGGRRAAGADDRPNAAAFGGRLLGAAWIQHPARRSALAAAGGGLAR